MKIKKNEIRWDILKEAVLATSKKRGSSEELKEYREIIEEMRESDFLRRIWSKYKDCLLYTSGIDDYTRSISVRFKFADESLNSGRGSVRSTEKGLWVPKIFTAREN